MADCRRNTRKISLEQEEQINKQLDKKYIYCRLWFLSSRHIYIEFIFIHNSGWNKASELLKKKK